MNPLPAKPEPFQFKTLAELSKGNAESILLYGEAGTGKTFFCGTGGPRTLFINIGNGIETLQSPFFTKLYPNAASMLTINIAEEMDLHGQVVVPKMFDAVCDALDFALKTRSDDFDIFVIDDASSLRRGAMNKAVAINASRGNSPATVTRNAHEVLVPGMDDYQREMSIIEQMVAGTTAICKQASKHLILTAHERNTWKAAAKMGDTPTLIRVSPSFTGVDKNPGQITQYFSNVWRTEVVSGGSARVYRIRTQGDELVSAKTRWAGVFETVETDLNLQKALERIRQSDPQKRLVGVNIRPNAGQTNK